MPTVSSFLEMMMKRAAKDSNKEKKSARRGRIADKNKSDAWLTQDGLMMELCVALHNDMTM